MDRSFVTLVEEWARAAFPQPPRLGERRLRRETAVLEWIEGRLELLLLDKRPTINRTYVPISFQPPP